MTDTLLRILIPVALAPWWLPVARALWAEVREVFEQEGLTRPRRQPAGTPLQRELDAPRGLVHKPRFAAGRDREAVRRASGLAEPRLVRRTPRRDGF